MRSAVVGAPIGCSLLHAPPRGRPGRRSSVSSSPSVPTTSTSQGCTAPVPAAGFGTGRVAPGQRGVGELDVVGSGRTRGRWRPAPGSGGRSRRDSGRGRPRAGQREGQRAGAASRWPPRRRRCRSALAGWCRTVARRTPNRPARRCARASRRGRSVSGRSSSAAQKVNAARTSSVRNGRGRGLTSQLVGLRLGQPGCRQSARVGMHLHVVGAHGQHRRAFGGDHSAGAQHAASTSHEGRVNVPVRTGGAGMRICLTLTVIVARRSVVGAGRAEPHAALQSLERRAAQGVGVGKAR